MLKRYSTKSKMFFKHLFAVKMYNLHKVFWFPKNDIISVSEISLNWFSSLLTTYFLKVIDFIPPSLKIWNFFKIHISHNNGR